jgi:tripartite-type tricarboxylate transporter receptor subunit TctC
VLAKPLKDPGTRKQMEALGYEVSGDGPAAYAAFLKTEIEKWAKVAKAAGIKPE